MTDQYTNILYETLPMMPLELAHLIAQYTYNPYQNNYNEVIKELKITEPRNYYFDFLDRLDEYTMFQLNSNIYEIEVLLNSKNKRAGVKVNYINIYKFFNNQYDIE